MFLSLLVPAYTFFSPVEHLNIIGITSQLFRRRKGGASLSFIAVEPEKHFPKMRAPVVVFGLLSVIAVLDPVTGVVGHEDGLWARVKRAISNLGGEEEAPPPYGIYGGPAPEEKAYSYPPYGYPPPPPEESSSEIPSSSGKTLIHLTCRWVSFMGMY